MEREETNCWYKELWNWQVPLKIKLFIFLMLEKRILTWENQFKRGFSRPSRCVLCGKDEEYVHHLFVTCNFTKVIWTTILRDLKVKSLWEGGPLVD
jgi:hypothetical protein